MAPSWLTWLTQQLNIGNGREATKRAPSVIFPRGWGGQYGEPAPPSAIVAPNLYVQSPAVYMAVTAKANRIASTALQLHKEQSEGDREEVTSHDLLTLLRNPNPFLSRYRLLWHTVSDRELTGNAYWFLAGPRHSTPTEIWRLNPRHTRVVRDAARYITGYITEVDGQMIPLEVEEVIHFPIANPFDEHDLYGLSRLSAARMAASTSYEMDKWNRNMFARDHAIPAGIVNYDDWVDDKKWMRIRQDWLNNHGAGARRTAFLRGGKMQWQQTGLSQTDVDFLAGSRWQAEQVYGVFGAWHLMPAKTEDDRKVQERTYLEEHVWPDCIDIAETLTDNLATFWGPAQGNGALFVSFDDIRPRERAIDLQERNAKVQAMTVNEVREMDGLKPLDGGDDVLFVHATSGTQLKFERDAAPEMPDPFQDNAEMPPKEDEDKGKQEDAQEKAERRESANDDTGDDIGESANKAVQVNPDPKAIQRELSQWQKFATARIGQDSRPFQTEAVPEWLAKAVTSGLATANSEADIAAVFDTAHVLLNGELPVSKATADWITTSDHTPTEVTIGCPLCGSKSAYQFDDHGGLCVCPACGKTFDPAIEAVTA
jgi:HK97 family phage portal protein